MYFKRKLTSEIESAYLPINRQVKIVNLLIWGVLILTVLGIIVTLFVSVDSLMNLIFSVMSTILIVTCCVSLLLLRSNRVVSATLLTSIVLYGSIITVVTPQGIGKSTLITVIFIIPLILLSYIWGRFGALVSFVLTAISYTILVVFESMGLTGWSVQEPVLWVDAGLQLMVFGIISVVIVRSQNEIVSVNRNLLELNESLRKTKQQLHNFTAGIVHDLGMPIQILYGQMRYLETHPRRISTEQLDLIRTFIEQTRLYLDVQNIAQILKLAPVSVVSVVINAMSTVSASQIAHRNITLNLDCDESLEPYVLGDEIAIRRIMDNLLKNALGVAPPSSIVTIRICDVGAYIELSVTDEGPGISLEDQTYIFEPYWSSSNGVRDTGTGWGLGLAIVRQLATAMEGDCGVVSELGSGSTFWIRLKQCETS